MEGDEGRDAGQHVSGLTGGLGRGWRLEVGSWGAVRAEGDVGHAATAGAISRRLVVVGVGGGGVLKVLLEFLQGDSLEGAGGRSQTEPDFAVAQAGPGSLRVKESH